MRKIDKYGAGIFSKIRTLIFYVVITITMILLYLILVTIHLFGANYDTKYKFAIFSSKLFIWILKITCSLDYKIKGLEKIPNVPGVFMANHQSFWDNMFMQLITPKHSWIIKQELLDIPFFGWGLKILEPIAVNRHSSMSVREIIIKGKQKIAEGMSMVIFPESTRLKVNEDRSFKPSGIKLAIEAGVPIVLIAHNSGLFWPKGFWIWPGTIEVEIIDVIYPEQFQDKDVRKITENVQKIIQEHKNSLAGNNKI